MKALIIPKKACHILLGILLLSLNLLSFNSSSQTPSTLKIGCLVNDYVYFQYLNVFDGGSYVFMGYAPYTTEGDTPTRYLWNTAAKNNYPCYSFNSVGSNCKIRTTSGGSTYISGIRGRFVFNATNCPIDTNIYYLIAATLITVFYHKKGSLFS